MRKISVSNLAWAPNLEGTVFARVQASGVRGVEVAPTRIAPWDGLTETAITEYRRRIEDAGLEVSSLQAIVYGRPDLQLLGSPESFAGLRDHMSLVANLAALLGAGVLVF